MLIQVPVNTWQAYNPGGGRSTYDLAGRSTRAIVSFDRPYDWAAPADRAARLGDPVRALRRAQRLRRQLPVRRLHRRASGLAAQHRLVAVAGHSEYWTKTMRDAFETARDSGVNLAFMGANDAYWQVRYEDGGADRRRTSRCATRTRTSR